MRRFTLALIFATVSVVSGAAQTLDDALRAGLVGETPGGYLASVVEPTDEVQAMIETVNRERLVEYTRRAS